MKDRTFSLLRAIETGTVEQYHDYQDVSKGVMTRSDYNLKYGGAVGSKKVKKHV